MSKNFVLIVITVFAVLSAVLYGISQTWQQFGYPLLFGANIIMATLSILTYIIVKKQIHEKPEAFVRGVYGATFLKLMICMISIVVYVLINKPAIHKPSLFVVFGIYIIYTAVETALLTKLAKQTKG